MSLWRRHESMELCAYFMTCIVVQLYVLKESCCQTWCTYTQTILLTVSLNISVPPSCSSRSPIFQYKHSPFFSYFCMHFQYFSVVYMMYVLNSPSLGLVRVRLFLHAFSVFFSSLYDVCTKFSQFGFGSGSVIFTCIFSIFQQFI